VEAGEAGAKLVDQEAIMVEAEEEGGVAVAVLREVITTQVREQKNQRVQLEAKISTMIHLEITTMASMVVEM